MPWLASGLPSFLCLPQSLRWEGPSPCRPRGGKELLSTAGLTKDRPSEWLPSAPRAARSVQGRLRFARLPHCAPLLSTGSSSMSPPVGACSTLCSSAAQHSLLICRAGMATRSAFPASERLMGGCCAEGGGLRRSRT